METVLRKVSVKGRLPENESYYHVELYTIDKNGLLKSVKWFEPYDTRVIAKWNELIEYWYEEVSLDSLLALEKQKWINEQLVHKEALYTEIDNHIQNLANERYEKSLTYVLQSRDMTRMPRQILNEEMYKALRIAAGIEENNKTLNNG